MLKKLDLFNNPHLGVFLHLSERLLFHPPGLTKKEIANMADTLAAEPVELTLGGVRVLGCTMVGNDRGLLFSDTASSAESAIR